MWSTKAFKSCQIRIFYVNTLLTLSYLRVPKSKTIKLLRSRILIPVKLNCFCCRADWGEGCSGEGGVALLGSGGAGEDGVEEVVDEGLLLESGWYGTGM